MLAADLMRGRIRNDDDFGQAANAAVTRNTDDLATIVGSLFGDQAATAFRGLWTDHVTALFNYSRGLATDDPAARDDAKAQLVAFENGLADFFSSAAQGRLPRDAARAAVQTHVEHLTEQADAYAAKDYARSDELYRETYAHTFDLGHTLAATLLPPIRRPRWTSPRGGCGRPSTGCSASTSRWPSVRCAAGGTNSPDFAAAAAALNGNTSDLSAAMGTLFGAQAGQQFMALWADHVDQLVAYTMGVAADDPAKRDAALARLRDFEGNLAAFLDSATGSKMHSADLAKAFLAHDQMLTQQVDAFAGRDYSRASDLAYSTYQDMFGLSGQLADAFGETVAARLPQGGAHTGPGARRAGRGKRRASDEGAGCRAGCARGRARRDAGHGGHGVAGGGENAGAARRGVDDGRTAHGRHVPVGAQLRAGPGAGPAAHPAAGVDTALVRLGRAADGSIEVPAQFDVAGWYDEGPRPGQPGPAVVLGHVDSRTGPAVFFRVAALPRDAQVLVDRADGSTVGVPGQRHTARPEGRVPHRPGVRPDARALIAAGDVRWQLRPCAGNLSGQRDRLCRSRRLTRVLWIDAAAEQGGDPQVRFLAVSAPALRCSPWCSGCSWALRWRRPVRRSRRRLRRRRGRGTGVAG